jgi:hypothetical protein
LFFVDVIVDDEVVMVLLSERDMTMAASINVE